MGRTCLYDILWTNVFRHCRLGVNTEFRFNAKNRDYVTCKRERVLQRSAQMRTRWPRPLWPERSGLDRSHLTSLDWSRFVRFWKRMQPILLTLSEVKCWSIKYEVPVDIRSTVNNWTSDDDNWTVFIDRLCHVYVHVISRVFFKLSQILDHTSSSSSSPTVITTNHHHAVA